MTTHIELPDFEVEEAQRPHSERGGFVRRIFRQANSWAEIGRTPYGLRPAILIGLVSMLGVFDDLVPAIAGPDIVRDLGISIGSILAILSITNVLGIFLQMLVGWYADRGRRVVLLGLGSLFSGAFSAGAAAAHSAFQLALPRVGSTLGNLGARVPANALLADYYPPQARGKAFAITGSLRTIAGPFAPIAVGAAVLAWGWRTSSLIFAAPSVVIGIAVLLFLREPIRGYMERRALGADEQTASREDEPRSLGESFRTIFAIRTMRRLFIGEIFGSFGAVVFAQFFGFYLAEEYGLNALERSYILVPGAVLAILGGYLGGGISDSLTRRNPGRVLTLSGVAGIAVAGIVAVVATTPPIAVIVVLVALFNGAFALIVPARLSAFAQVLPSEVRTQGFAVFAMAALPGAIIGLQVASTILVHYGFNEVFLFVVPFLVIDAIVTMSAAPFFDLDMRSAFASTIASEEWRRTRASGHGKLLVCRDVDVAYDGVQVLFRVDFDVDDGEIIALLGTNGAGKSTLLRAISGTTEASGGAIVFDGRNTTHMPPHEIAARKVIHMPGGRGVFPGLTVRDNLLLGRWLTADDPDASTRLREVFDLFPILRDRADETAGALSGGEQQQLSLAQAFLANPKLLMIDELSLGLAPAVVEQLLEIVREINRRGVTVIVVEQSVNVALRLAKRAVFMEKGEVRFFGDTTELLRRPDILRAVYVRGTGGAARISTSVAGRAAGTRRADELSRAVDVLEVDHVSKSFGGILALQDVNLSLRDGEVLGLIGPNGSGKTTLFDVISGYQAPDGGRIRMDGVDISDLSPEERAQRKLIRRFQDARLFPSLTVHEALMVAFDQQHEARNAALSLVQAPQARRAERRIRARADAIVEILGLEAYRNKLVGDLSTGLRRITDLACVLATQPRVLLLDEPSTGIASSEVEGLAPLLRRVRAETGCSILIIEHSMSLVSSVADRLVALDQGQVIAEGVPDDVLEDDRVVESYLGRTIERAKR